MKYITFEHLSWWWWVPWWWCWAPMATRHVDQTHNDARTILQFMMPFGLMKALQPVK